MDKNTDFYNSLAELDQDLVRDKHYRIRFSDRLSPITVISPHGGFIEAGTSHIAQIIAGDEHNFFDFQGLRRKRPWELHITSVKFRHPDLMPMLERSQMALSVHSMGTEDNGSILIGGLNSELKTRVHNELSAAGFPITTKARRYRGVHPKNIVNLAQNKGVQIELTSRVIGRMFVRRTPRFSAASTALTTTEYFDLFIAAVRRALTVAA